MGRLIQAARKPGQPDGEGERERLEQWAEGPARAGAGREACCSLPAC